MLLEQNSRSAWAHLWILDYETRVQKKCSYLSWPCDRLWFPGTFFLAFRAGKKCLRRKCFSFFCPATRQTGQGLPPPLNRPFWLGCWRGRYHDKIAASRRKLAEFGKKTAWFGQKWGGTGRKRPKFLLLLYKARRNLLGFRVIGPNNRVAQVSVGLAQPIQPNVCSLCNLFKFLLGPGWREKWVRRGDKSG